MNPHNWIKEHPVSVLMAWFALILFGIISFFELSFEELPDLKIPEIRIAAAFDGFPPDEMEQLVTIPMENALSAVRDVISMDSVSKAGTSSVTLNFDWGTDLARASMEVRECIDSLYPLLPRGVKKPVVYTSDLSHLPCMTLALIPVDGYCIEDLYNLVKYEIRGDFQKMNEVSQVEVRGLRKPEIHVDMDMDSLEVLNLTISECSQVLSGYLINQSIGKITDSGISRLVKMDSGISTPLEIAELSPFPGRSITLSDIASVRLESRDPTSLFLYEYNEGVGIKLYKNATMGTMEAVSGILKVLPDIQNEYKSRLNLVLIDESGSRIKESFMGLLSSLLWGLTAASSILFLLYREFRIPLITALSIPVTLVLVFFFLYLLDISLNTLSLMGMVVGIGLIADSSIVVLEEMSRPAGNIKKVSSALISSALTTIVVFLPPLFVPGITSVLFRDLIITILLTVALSLPVSHSFTPACFFLLGGGINLNRLKDRPYRKILLLSLRHKNRVLLLFILILVGTILLFLALPHEILPEKKTGKGRLNLSLTREKDFQEVLKSAQQIMKELKSAYNIKSLYLESGFDEDKLESRSEAGRSIHDLNIHIEFPSPEDEFLFKDNYKSGALYKTDVSLFESLLKGESQEGIALLSTDRNILNSFPLSAGYQDKINQKLPVLQFVSDHDSLNAAGLTGIDLVKTLSLDIEGTKAGEIHRSRDKEKIPIILRSSNDSWCTIENLLNLGIKMDTGLIRLGQLGSISPRTDSAELYRSDRLYMRPLSILIEDPVQNVEQTLIESLPGNIIMKNRRGTEGRQLVGLFLLALILMYLILGMQSGSPRRAALLFSSLPLSLPGSLIFLKILAQSLNLYSFIGLLILQGTIVNTAILLVSSYKNYSYTQILSSSSQRLRPVAATTLTTVTALIPVLCSSWKRNDPNATMALTVIGGMILGTILIMIIIPALYMRHSRHHD